jgi:GT2 family glycosyltransferase
MTAIVIPSLGGPHLPRCLESVAALEPAPDTTVVVISGGAAPPKHHAALTVLRYGSRLGFAAAVNTGLQSLGASASRVALLNDDAVPTPGWLAPLESTLDDDPHLAAVQGTVTDPTGSTVDGRGITFDAFGLPTQIDRGTAATTEPDGPRPVVAVSATAALYRREALRKIALPDGSIFDERFGSYHEDLDLGLRLQRLEWRSQWVADARAFHLGSTSGRRLRWRHPWWLIANRWRALAGNLTPAALLFSLPRLLRGELRAVRTLARENPRAPIAALATTAAIPWLAARGLSRSSAGPRLTALPGNRE